jgi:hypothetical protein
MNLDFFQNFFQHVALGSAAVLAILLATWFGTPRRTFVKVNRGISR